MTSCTPTLSFHLRFLHVLLGLLLLGTLLPAAAQAPQERAQTVIHMLDYVGVDYPEFVRDGKVLDEPEYQEQKEFASQSAQLIAQLPPLPEQPALLATARELLARIEARADGAEVAALARGLSADLVRAYQLATAPRKAPDLQRAAALFQAQCASCHGGGGRGDGPAAQGMEPAPSNFHDDARMQQRSIYGLYNTITLGVGGTPMRAFSELPEADRWALAFLAAGLRAPPEAVRAGEALWGAGKGRQELGDLRALVTTAPQATARQGGGELDAVRAFLTAQPRALESTRPAPLAFTRSTLQQALAAYGRGDAAQARQLAITAYLEGFELVEASLDNVDPGLRAEVEREMMALRSAIDAGAPQAFVTAQAGRIESMLHRAEEKLAGDGLSGQAAFASALLILLREGLEAILVLAAIIAFVRKTGRRDALPYVHAGWLGALALGLATWFAASQLVEITGANRELTEGVSALLASAMLLYVGYWLHRRSSARAWQSFLRGQVTAALEKRTLWAMAGVSFLAVYRELFEVVLFYQSLWAQAGPAGQPPVLAGIAAAAALLALLAWGILRYSVRLPIGPFFAFTSGLLLLMAVVFVGNGIAALQEAGVLRSTPVDFVSLPLLGIHPSAQGLLAQCSVAAAVFALMLASRGRAGPAAG